MKSYLFKVLNPEKAEEELLQCGLQDLYQIEDQETGEVFIGGRSSKELKPRYSELMNVEQAVDWEEQWAHFAEDFSEGKAHIDLKRFGKKATLLLQPGPGFGDLSHPTTELMLRMMKGRMKSQSIVDIGTGSGILALAALLLGASSAFGIDIDAAALKHARLNAKINHLQARFAKKLPAQLSPSIFLLNMILPEQQTALKRHLKRYNRLAKLWITSGILAEQKENYLQCTQSWGWKLKEIHKKKKWLGFVFRTHLTHTERLLGCFKASKIE
ncbi:MAG: 50S ribosomal protein L11 methyltransferase [Chlamydiales bacterium]|nr:50S ribosomal protein L11 methyltransferase [Chlamydiales bacterium]